MTSEPTHWLSLAVAVGCGLLIGIERERRKGTGATRAPAGIRTFTLTALAGAIGQLLAQPLLMAAGALLLIALSTVHAWRERSRDPGITTELALFATFLLGATAANDPALAGGAAAVVAILLAARNRLHRFSTQVLAEHELRDGLILAGAALVVLPLMPDQALPWLGALNPRALWRLVVLLLVLQAAGYVALRTMGAKIGLALSGLAAGFVSSTATFAAMGAQAAARPELARACAGGALFSNLATIAQLALVMAAVSSAVLEQTWPILILGAASAAAGALLTALRSRNLTTSTSMPHQVFNLVRSLGFAALIGGLTVLVAGIGDHFGARAALTSAMLSGFVDVHAAVASVCAMVERQAIAAPQSAVPVLLAFSANTLSKLIAAWVSGGIGFALRVLPGLAGVVLTLWGGWLVL